ncbi:MAG TPA: aromatic ring-hydroxylating dioxygenase subunit alpha [Acidimicrobiia bacterium]|nr:aromatic ring-hydroxylating dioxygenase subunit alpha [Acidimicrobiia bacterium]
MPPPAPLSPTALDQLLLPFGESRTLPAAAYRDPEMFNWETEHIFAGGWVCLGRVDDLLAPGQIRAVDHGPESFLLTRDNNGDVYGFSNVCRHRGHPLLEPGEPRDARLIRCPYHSWTYRLDGNLRQAPTLTQAPAFDPSEWPLHRVRVGEFLGWLFLDLSGEAPDLPATFGNLVEVLAPYQPLRLRLAARHSYEVAANWKLIVENYHECYHCTSIHPTLCQVTPVDSGRDIAPSGLWCGGTMVLKDHAATMSMTGESFGVNFPQLSEEQLRQVLYVGLWPNLLVSPHPDYVMTHRVVPLAAERTWVECDWLFPQEAWDLPEFDPSYAVDFWDLTNREDWRACENVQRGTRQRGFAPGPLSPWESTIYQFLWMVGTAYRGEPLTPPPLPTSHRLIDA